MVERTNEPRPQRLAGSATEADRLDSVFRSLGDPTRRDMLKRLGKRGMSIGDIAEYYDLTFAAVAKHVDVLARAGLVTKSRHGKEQVVTLAPHAFAAANAYLESYRQLWENRLSSLDAYMKKTNTPDHSIK